MSELLSVRYDNSKGVREFILKIVGVQSKLKNHNIPFNDNYIVYYTHNSLLVKFTQIKIIYNTIRGKWIVNVLSTKCVAEEENLKLEKIESVNLVGSSKSQSKRNDKVRNDKVRNLSPMP